MSEALRKGREGSRWFNERPSPEDVATWFKTVPLHEGMDHERYVGGIVLIEQKMKTNEIAGFDERGVPKIIEDVSHLTFTPYPKVETRVQYFTDLMGKHPEWLGLIEPIGEPTGLPPGYGTRTIQAGQKSGAFVYCTMRVRVYERETYSEEFTRTRDGEIVKKVTGKTIIDAPPATKMVALIDRWGKPDPFSMMKAETGAVGRALGMAGMLVVPGAGVATADDMREAEDGGAQAGLQTAEEAAPPPEAKPQPEADAAAPEPSEDEMRQRASNAIAALREDHPDAYVPFKAWADERGIGSLGEVKGPALKGLVRKAEKSLDAAKTTAPVHEPEPDAG